MRSQRGLLAAGAVLCWSLGSGLDSSALVQSGTAVHGHFGREDRVRRADPELGQGDELVEEPEEYLVDNSQLQHKGPGVLWRRSKDTNDIVGRDQYAAWGSTVSGVDAGDGWLKVGERYLPIEVRGIGVLVRKGPPKPRHKVHTTFQPTQMRSPDGGWVQANITGPGSKPGTWNVLVIPRTLASYAVDDVPEMYLQNVSSVKELIPVAPKPDPSTAAASAGLPSASAAAAGGAAAEAQEEEDDGVNLSVKVEDFVGTPMDLKFPKSSSLQTLMYMACERVSVPREKCTADVQFIHRGAALKEEDTPYAAALKRGDTIYMLRRKGAPRHY